MNFFKLSFAICILACGTGIISAQAEDNPAQAEARAALEKQFQSMTPSQPIATVHSPVAPKPKAAATTNTVAAVNKPGLKPIVAPALPISAAKQAQLDTLLDLYKADRISPTEYQKNRAAILAAP